jgi:glutamyl-tRNA reductase
MEALRSLLLVGTSYRTAPADVRGSLAGAKAMVVAACRDGHAAHRAITEAVIVSTCNRLEVYAAAEDLARASAVIEGALCAASGGHSERIRSMLYSLQGCDAARHLMRVAAGLDSMVLGETQILGQVSQSVKEALESKTAGALLSRLFNTAIHAGRLAHAQTAIGRFPTSISHVAVSLLRKRLPQISNARILLVGAGTIATVTARVLQKNGATTLAFINRTHAAASVAAAQSGAAVYPWDHLREALEWADVAIVATGADHPVICAADVSREVFRPRQLLMLDLAVPPNVDAAVADLNGVQLIGIDNLDSNAVENVEKRRAAIPEVEMLIAVELNQFMTWWAGRRAAPLITDLRRKLNHVANEELTLALADADRLDAEQRQVVTRLVHRVTNKLLHEPTVRLKSLHACADHYHNAVRDLFALGHGDSAAGGM